MTDETDSSLVDLATELTIAWLGNSNTRVSAEEVPAFLRTMHAAVSALSTGSSGGEGLASGGAGSEQYVPAVTARKSLASPDHIISMIDGKPYKTLRRHLSTNGLSPKEYRERYKLKPDYPIVAPNYSETRRALAKKIGLGNKGRAARMANTTSPTSVPANPGEAPAAKPGRKPRVKKPA